MADRWADHMNRGLMEALIRRFVEALLVSVSLVGAVVGYHAFAQTDAKSDEYAVYSAVLSSMSTGTKLVVIKDSTVNYPVDAGLLRGNRCFSSN
jgi:hypothetical protein